MGCAKCGGSSGDSCCLCQRGSGVYKWGANKKICTNCKNKQTQDMQENERMAIRTRTLLAGFDFSWKDLRKWKKHWCAKSVEKR